jgi:hypothetical protein
MLATDQNGIIGKKDVKLEQRPGERGRCNGIDGDVLEARLGMDFLRGKQGNRETGKQGNRETGKQGKLVADVVRVPGFDAVVGVVFEIAEVLDVALGVTILSTTPNASPHFRPQCSQFKRIETPRVVTHIEPHTSRHRVAHVFEQVTIAGIALKESIPSVSAVTFGVDNFRSNRVAQAIVSHNANMQPGRVVWTLEKTIVDIGEKNNSGKCHSMDFLKGDRSASCSPAGNMVGRAQNRVNPNYLKISAGIGNSLRK